MEGNDHFLFADIVSIQILRWQQQLACATTGKINNKTKGCGRKFGTRHCQKQEKTQDNKGGSNLTSIINNATERGYSNDTYYIKHSKVNFFATCHDYCDTVS